MNQTQPNFLFIITDQHRADHLGCYGNDIVRTPHIDSLANAGCRWDRFYVANPICMPNRASIMTGRMSSLHGARHNGIPLSLEHTTFVELLKDAGYNTALIGKSHLQSFTGLPATQRFESKEGLHTPDKRLRDAIKNNRHGKEYDHELAPAWNRKLSERIDGDFYGFEHFEVAADHADAASGDYLLWAREQEPQFDKLTGPQNALPGNGGSAPQAWRTAVPEELYSTSWVAERSAHYLRDRADDDRPFFLQMSFPDPHHPFTPPGKYWDMYDPQSIPVPASLGKSNLPPIESMRKAMESGTDPRDNQSPFAVTADEARVLTALTYGSITMIDDAIGRVIKQLHDSGLADNTIIIFTTDHGDYMGDHGLMLKLLLHYQGLIRVPFIWHDPISQQNTIQPGAVDSALASSIDISATVLARAGIQAFNGIQGRDLCSTEAPDAIIVEEDSQRLMTGFDRPQRIRTVVTNRFRMSLRQDEAWDELYDLQNDPLEICNQYDNAEFADTRHQLTELMLRRMIELQDRSPLPAYRA
ncbi:MAG: sulfatase-like hydrolase/transferase [Granulosicoccus sp.]|nr:sulfatase-like hydrolase/transferase [Granulosicoccus sp.]